LHKLNKSRVDLNGSDLSNFVPKKIPPPSLPLRRGEELKLTVPSPEKVRARVG